MKNVFKLIAVSFAVLMSSCNGSDEEAYDLNSFPITTRSFNLVIQDSNEQFLSKSDALWEDKMWENHLSSPFESIEVTNYIGDEVYSLHTDNQDELATRIPFMLKKIVEGEEITDADYEYMIDFNTYIVSEYDQVPCDRTVIELTSELIFKDKDSHKIEITWDNSGEKPFILSEIASVTIDGVGVSVGINDINNKDYSYAIYQRD